MDPFKPRRVASNINPLANLFEHEFGEYHLSSLTKKETFLHTIEDDTDELKQCPSKPMHRPTH